ncbi:hypothetical protein C8R47DRAFT_1078241 [Mycena vitilis]|nr:hypothetical protein C8R47DRAFT_1078241 [Mycena vitilis]
MKQIVSAYTVHQAQDQANQLSLSSTSMTRNLRRPPKRKKNSDSDEEEYLPGTGKSGQQVLNHRKYQARYRARNLEIILPSQRAHIAAKRLVFYCFPLLSANLKEVQRWEGRRFRTTVKCAAMRQARNKAKLERQGPLPESTVSGSESIRYHDERPETGEQASNQTAAANTVSATPEEQLACLALAELADGVDKTINPVHSTNSVLHSVNQAGNLPAGVTALSRIQERRLQFTGDVGDWTPVQAAQICVAEANLGELTCPTAEEARAWAARRPTGWDLLSYEKGRDVESWRRSVSM